MEKWEYLTTFCEANAGRKAVRQFLKEKFEIKRPPLYTPEALIPELNDLGEAGWELIHMEPVARVGAKGDVLFDGEGVHWSNVYFCVFKRLKAVDNPPYPQRVDGSATERPILPPDAE